MKLFQWEEVEGAKMTAPSHPTAIRIPEGLGVEVEEEKSSEGTEVREKGQKEKIKDYEMHQRKSGNGRQSTCSYEEAIEVSGFPIIPWHSPNCLAPMMFQTLRSPCLIYFFNPPSFYHDEK